MVTFWNLKAEVNADTIFEDLKITPECFFGESCGKLQDWWWKTLNNSVLSNKAFPYCKSLLLILLYIREKVWVSPIHHYHHLVSGVPFSGVNSNKFQFDILDLGFQKYPCLNVNTECISRLIWPINTSKVGNTASPSFNQSRNF